MPRVSVIISNRNDIAMLAVTVRSILEELKPLDSDGEIIICDNSDPETYKLVASAIPSGYVREKKIKVYRQEFPCLFTARETAIEKASSEYIVCVDSHMIIGRDMILDLVSFMERNKEDETIGFAHAPISWAHQHERVAKHDRDVSQHELGGWGTRKDSEQTITWKGMPWICRRDWFLDKTSGLGGYGALAEHKISWGGGDMHIGVKPWLLGFKNWAVPTSPAIHIGPFPKVDLTENKNIVKVAKGNGYRYRLWAQSGTGPHAFGFLVSCFVLGGEKMMLRNKVTIAERFGRFIDVDKWWHKAMEFGTNEKRWLDKRKVMTFEEYLITKPWEQEECQSAISA